MAALELAAIPAAAKVVTMSAAMSDLAAAGLVGKYLLTI